jgi:hypothetical protein
MPTPSTFVLAAHYLLVLVLVGIGRGVFERSMPLGARAPARRAAFLGLAIAWLGGTLALARAGALYEPGAAPPRILLLMGPSALAVLALCFSPFGARVLRTHPVTAIVAFQLFRAPVELLLWQLHREGLLPERMTFEGDNHEWVTIALVPLVLLACRRRVVPAVVLAWNAIGLATLIEIMVIAVRSMPGPWQAYTEPPANTIVLTSSFVWIPAVYVLTAFASHALIFRALLTRGWRAEAR